MIIALSPWKWIWSKLVYLLLVCLVKNHILRCLITRVLGFCCSKVFSISQEIIELSMLRYYHMTITPPSFRIRLDYIFMKWIHSNWFYEADILLSVEWSKNIFCHSINLIRCIFEFNAEINSFHICKNRI